MVHINAYTKRGQDLIKRYNNSKYRSIRDCYCNPSQNKVQAEMMCLSTMIDTNGNDYRIISYNTMQFTCGWKTATGLLRVETAYNSYLIY